MSKLRVVPITVKAAMKWVSENHSHHAATVGGLFAVGIAEGDRLCCVAIAGRPVARAACDGKTVEITRVASDRTRHAASKAIAALTRAAMCLGYRRVISYTMIGEAGVCYRAAGWRPTALTEGGEWTTPTRYRRQARNPQRKIRWEFGPEALPCSEKAARALRDALVSECQEGVSHAV